MIRPEARATLWRWREVLVAAALALLGARWLAATGVFPWLGAFALVVAAALAFAGWQRGRFRAGDGGPGVVQIIEGRVSYFGPLDGGFADIRDLTSLALDGSARPPHWLLGRDGQDPLAIPVSAQGADALFDAFAALPELDTGALSRAAAHPAAHRVVIWESPAQRRSRPRLH